MKKRWILCVSCIVLFLIGCAHDRMKEKKADDEISEEIIKNAGGAFYYHGRETDDDGTTLYIFEIRSFSVTDIERFVKTCNELASSINTGIGFRVFFCSDVGANPTMFFIGNYNDENELYDGMRYLRIWDQTRFNDKACNPELYSGIEGIRELHIGKAIQDKADDMGIDWYDYWPELEKLVIEEK